MGAAVMIPVACGSREYLFFLEAVISYIWMGSFSRPAMPFFIKAAEVLFITAAIQIIAMGFSELLNL